ncbi:MAG: PAS domain S-box protein [Nitrospirae bacterium]|nr:PAS domain S-box protein [Nitrospirota bacterium]
MADMLQNGGESGLTGRKDSHSPEVERLQRENEDLRQRYAESVQYIRSKINQLLTVMGTAPLRPEELDDRTLIELDPIGIISGSFSQVLEHLHETNEQLKAANNEIQAIFDAAGMGILVIDRSMKVVAYNAKLKDQFFPERDVSEGFACHDMICNLSSPLHECPFLQVFETGKSVRQMRWKLKGRYFDVVGAPIANLGEISGIVIVYMDITERVLAEEALRKSEERYRDLFENANDLVQSIGPDGSFQYVNRAWMETMGYGPEELSSLTIFDVLYPGCSECSSEFKDIVFGDKEGRIETRFFTKDRREIIVEGNINAVFEGGKRLGARGIFRDITERKKAEEILASERERLAVTLRSIGDGVITTDTAGRITLMNKMGEDLTGWSQEEAVGSAITDVFRIISERTRTCCENPVEKVLKDGNVTELMSNTVLITKDGTERLISDSVAPIRDRQSRIIGTVLVFRDITERRKMEEQLMNAEKIDSLGVLAGGIAHDFNNLLNAIMGNIDLALLSSGRGGEIQENLERAEKAALRARDLTTQLLTFSRGGAPIRKTASITELIRDSADFALRGSNSRAQFIFPDDLWKAVIDEGQISQVVNNLVLNAAQAMPQGGTVRISAHNIEVPSARAGELKPGRYVRITVSDEGTGIPHEHLKRIFEPYFTTKIKGSGLGLATSYSIVRSHEGSIEVESDVGRGTTIRVYLPASLSQKGKGDLDVLPVCPPGSGRVLLMDDEDIIRQTTGLMLQRLGYEVELAADGRETLDKYKEALSNGRRFDAVIMDLTIPGGIGGREAMELLRGIDPSVRGIVSSGYSSDAVMANYRQYGFAAVLAKPYRKDELAAVLQEVLSGGAA